MKNELTREISLSFQGASKLKNRDPKTVYTPYSRVHAPTHVYTAYWHLFTNACIHIRVFQNVKFDLLCPVSAFWAATCPNMSHMRPTTTIHFATLPGEMNDAVILFPIIRILSIWLPNYASTNSILWNMGYTQHCQLWKSPIWIWISPEDVSGCPRRFRWNLASFTDFTEAFQQEIRESCCHFLTLTLTARSKF